MCECSPHRFIVCSFVLFRGHSYLPLYCLQLSKIRVCDIQIRCWGWWHSLCGAIKLLLYQLNFLWFILMCVCVHFIFIDRARRNVHIPSSSRNRADGHVMSASTTISRRSVHIYGNASSNHIFYLIGRWSFSDILPFYFSHFCSTLVLCVIFCARQFLIHSHALWSCVVENVVVFFFLSLLCFVR